VLVRRMFIIINAWLIMNKYFVLFGLLLVLLSFVFAQTIIFKDIEINDISRVERTYSDFCYEGIRYEDNDGFSKIVLVKNPECNGGVTIK
jgi:hypothetical protein